jgi:hypothetical protein
MSKRLQGPPVPCDDPSQGWAVLTSPRDDRSFHLHTMYHGFMAWVWDRFDPTVWCRYRVTLVILSSVSLGVQCEDRLLHTYATNQKQAVLRVGPRTREQKSWPLICPNCTTCGLRLLQSSFGFGALGALSFQAAPLAEGFRGRLQHVAAVGPLFACR